MVNSMKFHLGGTLAPRLEALIDEWSTGGIVPRIWKRDAAVWQNEDESKWLGWLDVVDKELADADKYRELQGDIESTGFSQILLMGMGGSSLCPEVLSMTFGKGQFGILDSTAPSQV